MIYFLKLIEEKFLINWKDCYVPNCTNKICTWASNYFCFPHRFYGKLVSKKRIKKDRKKKLIP